MGGVKGEIMGLFNYGIIIKVERNQKKKKKKHYEKIKQSEDNIIKDARNLFQVLKENEVIRDKIIRDIRTLFESEKKKNHYEPVRVVNFLTSNGDRRKTLSIEE